MGGFTVVQQALIDAAEGVSGATYLATTRKISAVDASKAHIGHSGLASACGEFTDRWQIGVSHLIGDGDKFAVKLRETAQAYLDTDAQATTSFDHVGGK